MFLTGNVRSADLSENARQIAVRFVRDAEDVVNLLSIVEDQQVLLQVRIAEVQRNILKDVGIDGAGTFLSGDLALNAATISNLIAPPFGLANAVFDPQNGDLLTLTLNALEQNGLVKSLAEPNLTAISGETASFLAGGEIPFPVIDEDRVTIEFRPFGVGINFTPVVLNSGRISLRLGTEVSAPGDPVVAGGVATVTINVRRADTTVELPSGGSLIIAGLIQDDMITGISGLPWLKDVPILGPFFRSNSVQRNETELVIAVTAYLVRPIDHRQVKLPGAEIGPPSDYDLFFLGRLEAIYRGTDVEPVEAALKGPIGYIVK